MIARLVPLLFLLVPLAEAQKALPEEVLLLSRIKNRMQGYLKNVPNFTCLQTMERFQKRPGMAQPELIDVVRLEVAYVGGQELFGWPGSQRFEEQELSSLVSTGAFSNGNFVLHPKAVFDGDGPTFEYAGEANLQDRAAHLFHFDTPTFRSGYQIRNGANQQRAIVPYKGSFWASAKDLDVLRLYLEGVDIPDFLEITHASHQFDFQLVPIGSIIALLPKESIVRLSDAKGVESENRVRLSRCKQYQGESTLKFEELTDDTATIEKKKERRILPAGITLPLALNQELNMTSNAVGDAIIATVQEDVRLDKQLIVPKGAVASGRIVRMERDLSGTPAFVVTLRFEELSTDSWAAPLRLRLERTAAPQLPPRSAYRMEGDRLTVDIPNPGPNGFTVFGNSLRLSRGFLTVWQTQTVVP